MATERVKAGELTERVSRRDSWRVEIDLPGFPKTKRVIKKFKSQETGDIFEDFFGDWIFVEDVKATLGEFLKGGSNSESLAKFRQELAAFLFEQYAFRLVKKRLVEIGGLSGVLGSVVLSPQLTAIVISVARPDLLTAVSCHGLKRTKHGIRNPDGILLAVGDTKTAICGLCEYSLTSDNPSKVSGYKRDQLAHFTSDQFTGDLLVSDSASSRVGHFLNDTRSYHPKLIVDRQSWTLIYVRPRRTLKHRQDYLVRDRLVVVIAPFSANQWGRVVDGLFADIQSSQAPKPVSAD